MMTRGKKLSTLEIRNLSRFWGFPEGKLICSRDERLIYNPWTSRSLVREECSGRSTRTRGRDKNNFFIFFTAVNKRKREGLSVKEFCSLSCKKFFLCIYIYIYISSSMEEALEIGCMFKGKQVKRYQIKSKEIYEYGNLYRGMRVSKNGKIKKGTWDMYK